MTTLFDQAAREAIAHDLDHTLFVEAGAGTGKTSALVARLVALVQRGAPLTQIAAITFTEAAAAELRERVREALGAAATSGEPGADRCADALAHFDDTTISTLHAFAQRVLAEFPVEAGLPPGFEVLDDIQASIDFAERWARFLDRLYADPAAERALTVLGALGFRMDRLEALAQLIHDDWDRLVDQSLPAARAVPAGRPRAGARRARHRARVRTRVSGRRRQPAPAPAGSRRASATALAAVGDDEAAALEVLAERPRLDTTKGQKGNWPDKPAVVAALVAAEATVDAEHRRAHGSGGRPADACGHRVRARVRRGAPPRRAARVPRPARARARPRARTTAPCAPRSTSATTTCCSTSSRTPTRCRSSSRCSSRPTIPRPGTKPWWECSVPSGRLFLVGDPKQSIYRFRRADIELYHRVRDYFGTRLTLSTNFRSRPGVIEFVNSVFAALLGTGDPLGVQAAYDALVPSRDGAPAGDRW